MEKSYKDYAGFRDVVAAEVIQDNSTNYESNEWQQLEGAIECNVEFEESSTPRYRDNKAIGTVTTEGADTATIVMDVLANKIRAWLEGRLYSEKTGAYIKAPKKNRSFAVGFIAGFTDGTEEATIMYSTSVVAGANAHKTLDDGTDVNTKEYTFTGVYTKKRFTITIDGEEVTVAVKSYSVPITDTLTEEMIFGTFTDGKSNLKVLTPDQIEALVTA